MERLHTMWLAVVGIGAAGCACTRWPQPAPLSDPALAGELIARLVVPPTDVEAQFRVLLARASGEVDMTLQVALRAPDRLRMVAVTDLGGVLFQAVGDLGALRVEQAVPLVDEPSIAAIARDLVAIWLPAPPPQQRLVRLADGRPALHAAAGPFQLLRHGSDPRQPLERLWLYLDGCQAARLRVERFAGEPPGRPQRVVSDGGGRRLAFELLHWQALTLDDAVFQIGGNQ
jgi:hypothetical protein